MIKFDKTLYYYDKQAAQDVIDFIETFCVHIRGDKAGQPLKLAGFWKEDIIKPAFGIKRLSNNKRRFKTVYVEIGKGNAKSTVGSAIALYLLGFDTQMGAEVYSVAGDREQARIIFDTARFMVEEETHLQTIFETYQYSIVRKGTAGFYKVLSSEAKGKHGFIPSGIIFDEIHVQPNRDLWDTLTAGQMKRDESICFAFTTAGYNKDSICFELHEKAVNVNAGIIKDDSFLGVIYTVDEMENIASPKTWKKANPGLGEIISYENLQIEYNKVLASPSYENTFRRLHLNQWTSSDVRWINDDTWMKCDQGEMDLTGAVCYAGLDLSSVRDTTSLVLFFPGEPNCVLCDIFVPQETVNNRQMHSGDYPTWIRQGHMIATPGNAVDYSFVKKRIMEVCEKYQVQSIAVDRWNSSQLIIELVNEGLNISPYGQGFASMSFPTKEVEKLILGKKINHFGNPVLRWMVANTMLETDASDNVKPSKKKSTDKIDGVVSLVMAVGEWLTKGTVRKESIYENQDILEI